MKTISWKQFGALILIILGLILAFSPINKDAKPAVDKANIADQILRNEDQISAEQLGHLIIDKDPGYVLIDVRKPQEFEKFHIETATNIPMDILFNKDMLDHIDRRKLVILYSNSDTHSAQAWVLMRQSGFENLVILTGGLNYWVEVYTNPTPPPGHFADSEYFKYQFRKSAGAVLLGKEQAEQSSAEEITPVNITPVQRSKKKKADEGC